jgi:hypothetical protein
MKSARQGRWLSGGAVVLAALSLVWVTGCGKGSAAPQASRTPEATASSRTALAGFPSTSVGDAIVQAGKDGKYSFVLFYRPKEQASETMRATLERAKGKLKAKAVLLSVDIDAKSEAGLVEKFRARQAPLPLTLVIAPNGATIRGFTKPVDEATLAGAFVSPKVAEVAKALQDRRVVALCLQGPATKHNRESKRAAEQFVADQKLGGQAVLVTADPSRETDLLKRCRISAAPAEATIVLLAPPGSMVGTFAGATTKEALLQKLQSAGSSCSSGSCGPSGCQ